MEEKQLYGALTVYRERGAYLRRLEQFEKAKAAYDEAYNNIPDDVRLLTGRSQVCSDAVKPTQAYADAELALKLEPGNMIAKNMQARAMYVLSDFEKSVVINYRGSRQRRQPPYFLEGIIQGKQTIQDCLGKKAGPVMSDFLPLITQQAERVDENYVQNNLRVSRIPRTEKKLKLTQMEARKHSTLARVLAMKNFGPMAYDKFFLQELTEDPRIKSANHGGNQELHNLIQEALKTLSERQEMLRSQRPYYAVKYAEKSQSTYHERHKETMLINERKTGARTATRLLIEIEKCMRTRNIMDLIGKAERMQLFLDSKTPRTLPDKELYTDRLYRAVGEGYLSQYRLSHTLSERGNRRRVAFLMGLPTGRPTSFDSVMTSFPYKFVDVKEASEKLIITLDLCANSTMKCWLMYEISRLLCIQKDYPRAKFYARKCQREAEEISNNAWWLNACFALMSADMQQGNINEVKVQAEEAFAFSCKIVESERIRAFLLKCADVAAEVVLTDELKAVKQREKQILNIMDDRVRAETLVLFKRMSTVPLGRRFSVLPRNKPGQSQGQSERKRRRQCGLSVIPGPMQVLSSSPSSKILGFQTFYF